MIGRVSPMRTRTFAISLAILATSSACHDEREATIQAVTGPPKGAPAVLEVALVATDAADPKARAYEYRGNQVRLVDMRALTVAKAGVRADVSGALLLEFELAQPDSAGLGALTRENIGRTLATVIDGKVMLITPISSELPGVGMLSLGPAATRADLEELARRLMAKR